MDLRSDPRATDRILGRALLFSLCSLLAAPCLPNHLPASSSSCLENHPFRLATMDVSEMSFDPGALTPEAVEAARRISLSWPDDLINYVFLKEQGRFFRLSPGPTRASVPDSTRCSRTDNSTRAGSLYYAFVRATIFERVPQVLRRATTVSRF